MEKYQIDNRNLINKYNNNEIRKKILKIIENSKSILNLELILKEYNIL